jgi:hypothetical protein
MRSVLSLLLVVAPHLLLGQGTRTSAPHDVVGTYRHFGVAHEGCAIEVGERRADSVRVQFDCNRGAPSFHRAANDLRLPLHNSVATYDVTSANGKCTIRFAFSGEHVRVTQVGSDVACGFGAFVNIGGTYPRVSRRPPKFDLLPL